MNMSPRTFPWILYSVAMSVVALTCRVIGQNTIDVTTPSGVLRGIRVAIGDNSYVDKFYSIPFARPPLGDLRFKSPQKNPPWSGVRDATQPGSQCPQFQNLALPPAMQLPNNEDCLYLNVFAPQSAADGDRMPVMVWIHGGGYASGTANVYDGSVLASKGVVVVTVNYRLGALGFLSTEDGASLGNYGLLDQIRALEWVRDSISAFNGDPHDVTIFGESAGSTSVSLLLLTSAARGLFHKAIMESGVSLTPWAMAYPKLVPRPLDQTMELATRLECPKLDTDDMVNCLRTKDFEEIVNASIGMSMSTPIPFRPVPESSFGDTDSGLFEATPMEILDDLSSNVKTIRGFNKDEAATEYIDPDNDGITLAEFQETVEALVSRYFTLARPHGTNPVDINRIQTSILDTYVYKRNLTDPFDLRAARVQMGTDHRFLAPTLHEIKLSARQTAQPQYLYRFSYRSPNRLTPQWTGVVHGDELRYVFGFPIANTSWLPGFASSWTEEDVRVSKDIITMWTNFAKYGDPTPQGYNGVKWSPWTENRPVFLDIADPSHMRTDVMSDDIYNLWSDVVPRIVMAGVLLIG